MFYVIQHRNSKNFLVDTAVDTAPGDLDIDIDWKNWHGNPANGDVLFHALPSLETVLARAKHFTGNGDITAFFKAWLKQGLRKDKSDWAIEVLDLWQIVAVEQEQRLVLTTVVE